MRCVPGTTSDGFAVCALTSDPGYVIYSACGSFWVPMIIMMMTMMMMKVVMMMLLLLGDGEMVYHDDVLRQDLPDGVARQCSRPSRFHPGS